VTHAAAERDRLRVIKRFGGGLRSVRIAVEHLPEVADLLPREVVDA
jgi:hypothetical protein